MAQLLVSSEDCVLGIKDASRTYHSPLLSATMISFVNVSTKHSGSLVIS